MKKLVWKETFTRNHQTNKHRWSIHYTNRGKHLAGHSFFPEEFLINIVEEEKLLRHSFISNNNNNASKWEKVMEA